jgi:hypothetical protein
LRAKQVHSSYLTIKINKVKKFNTSAPRNLFLSLGHTSNRPRINSINQQGRLFKSIACYVTSAKQETALLPSTAMEKDLVSLSLEKELDDKKRRFDLSNPYTLYFLGGFVEGEGSNSVSISIGTEFKYGVNIQPLAFGA